MGKPMLFARLPDGSVVTRQSHHGYTHVIAVKDDNGKWFAWGWTGKNGRPVKPVRAKYGWVETRLVPVEPS